MLTQKSSQVMKLPLVLRTNGFPVFFFRGELSVKVV